MKTICVCCNIFAVGGLEIGFYRLAKALPQYKWVFDTNVVKSDVLIYNNDDRFYHQAKQLGMNNIILRYSGPRSYNLPAHEDLAAVICSSQTSYDLCGHPRKRLIYNGIDLDYVAGIKPIKCQALVANSRVGKGQAVDVAIKWAAQNKKHLTVLGGRQHLHENTYEELKKQFPWVCWPGLVTPEVASAYIKGCDIYVMPTKIAGISNAIIEAVINNKPIVNIGNVELPPKDQIDIKVSASKYDELIKGLI